MLPHNQKEYYIKDTGSEYIKKKVHPIPEHTGMIEDNTRG